MPKTVELTKKKKSSVALPSELLGKFAILFFVISLILAFVAGYLWRKVETLSRGKEGAKVIEKGEQPLVSGKLTGSQLSNVPKVTGDDRVNGSRDAEVLIIEYSDLECPFCKSFHPTLKKALEVYGGKVAWVYRHFPLDGLHPKADKEAEAAECAFEIGGEDAFWAYIDRVFQITPSNDGLNPTELPKIAAYVGLDKNIFDNCLNSGRYKNRVESQYQGGIKAGITGTPGNFVVNKKGEVWYVGGAVPFETLQKTIDEALGK